MRTKIEAVLATGTARSSYAVWDYERFEPLAKQATKELNEWISVPDVYNVLQRQVGLALGSDKTGPLSELLGAEGLKRLADAIVADFNSIPRAYVVYVPLPNVEVAREVALTPEIALVPIKQKQNALVALQPLRGLEFTHTSVASVTFLRVPARGYASYGWANSSAMREAAAMTKRVFQVAILRRALATFTFRPRAAAGGLFGVFGTSEMQQLEAVACLAESPTSPVARAFIDANTTSHLRNYGNAEANEDEQERAFKGLSLILGALTSEPADPNTKSIRSALEWAFDSAADPDPPSSFVKTSIALEAALGEESESQDITERLADRCAFLLNKTASDRANTRGEMRQIYKLRSKVVHGVRRRFDNNDDELRIKGRVYLDLVLDTELRAIEAWHVRHAPTKKK